MKFNLLYRKICEEEDIFKASTPEEGVKRKEQYIQIRIDEIMNKAKKNEDGSYDVDGDVNLRQMSLRQLPIKFNIVTGDFDCARNYLTTLKGSPNQVGRDFSCAHNLLTTLIGGPTYVERDFNCPNNKLTSLEGAPKRVGGWFLCYDNSTKFTWDDVRSVTQLRAYNVSC